MHAADVAQTVNSFIALLEMQDFLTVEDIFGIIVAALVHDIEHPGVSNAFLIATNAPLALRFNDKSVLENFHCSTAFELMLEDQSCNILAVLKPDQLKYVRKVIISCVLATDLSSHFEFITKFKTKVAGTGFDFEDQNDRLLIMSVAIKCADVSNPAKSLTAYKQWTERIMEEFFRQGDQEKKKGLPVSMFMDRMNDQTAKCQIGFIDFIVQPLFEAWDMYMNDNDVMDWLQILQTNRGYWESQVE